MPTMLRHTPTGDLYPFNPDLARRDDMVQYTPPPEGAVEEPVQVEEVTEEIVVEAPKPKIVQPVKLSKKPKDEPLNLDDL